jgi:hypothetical protein
MSHYSEQRAEDHRAMQRRLTSTDKPKTPKSKRESLRTLRNRTERLELELHEARKAFWVEFKRVHGS